MVNKDTGIIQNTAKTTLKAGVIGWPIEHSKSPILHGYWLKKYQIDGIYNKIAITPDNLETGIEKLLNEGYCGFNVTIPYKERIIPLLASIDNVVKKIGAVNTVVIDSDKKLHGFNTDAFGFWQNLQNSVANFTPKSMLLIGAGGAARAVLYSAIKNDVEKIYMVNRTRTRTEALAQEFANSGVRIKVADFSNIADILKNEHIDLLVNSSSIGMAGGGVSFDLSLFDNLQKGAVVYDLVYTPLLTDLLAFAKEKNCQIVDGLGMLIWQAMPAFEKFFGILPKIDNQVRELLLK